jgi:hypothetical protein
MTALHDHDLRGLVHIAFHMPKWRVKQILSQIRNRLLGRKNAYPLSLTLLEITGNLIGPWSLWRSYRNIKRHGRSEPYLPVSKRPATEQQLPNSVPYSYPSSPAHLASGPGTQLSRIMRSNDTKKDENFS